MGSPVTLSGFNSIDFNLILTSIMTQESQPLVALQSRQSALENRLKTLSTLTSRISSLESAADALSSANNLTTLSATSSDTTTVAVSSGSSAIAGRYDIVVSELARAQVTASASTAPDADTTVVATGGTLTIGGVTVNVGVRSRSGSWPTPSIRRPTRRRAPRSYRPRPVNTNSC